MHSKGNSAFVLDYQQQQQDHCLTLLWGMVLLKKEIRLFTTKLFDSSGLLVSSVGCTQNDRHNKSTGGGKCAPRRPRPRPCQA